jgi:catechol 2,3-dioxygenase-like lactoylglutathione lyase family enzyme
MIRALAVLALAFAMPVLAGTPSVSLIGPALRASNEGQSLAFYTKGLGMVVAHSMDGKEVREVILGFSKEKPQPGIILLFDRNTTAPKPIVQGYAYSRTVLRVSDIDAMATQLISAGYAPTPIRDVTAGYRMMLVTDPDGYRYEIVQSGPKVGQAKP